MHGDNSVKHQLNVWHCLCYLDIQKAPMNYEQRHRHSANTKLMPTLSHSFFKKGTVNMQSVHEFVTTFWCFDNEGGKQQALHVRS
jgi:hypothetical protein